VVSSVEIVDDQNVSSVDYSICTLVTDFGQYHEMLESFSQSGFDESRCEFLHLDNSNGNKLDGYKAVNRFLRQAQGRYVVFCHQDVLLIDDINRLDCVIKDMDVYDPRWAVLANAGGEAPGKIAVRITDAPYGKNAKIGVFPAKVDSVDENFIMVKAEANLAVSNDMEGFHLYGTDLCLVADLLGYNSYVVDFHLHHLGGESMKFHVEKKVDTSPNNFKATRQRYIKKYQRAFRPRWIQTTCTLMHVSGSSFRNFWANHKYAFSVQKKIARWFR
jgi:hypothetical protein